MKEKTRELINETNALNIVRFLDRISDNRSDRSEEELLEKAKLWSQIFKGFPLDAVEWATMECWRYQSLKKTFPSPEQLSLILATTVAKGMPEFYNDPEEAWVKVKRVMNSVEFKFAPESAFEQLPEIIQESVGTYRDLVKWSQIDDEYSLREERLLFIAKYKQFQCSYFFKLMHSDDLAAALREHTIHEWLSKQRYAHYRID